MRYGTKYMTERIGGLAGDALRLARRLRRKSKRGYLKPVLMPSRVFLIKRTARELYSRSFFPVRSNRFVKSLKHSSPGNGCTTMGGQSMTSTITHEE
jgi:hypothetical protein